MREIWCEDCPLSWEERGLEDCDCGCYVYDDLYDGQRLICKLPTFIKQKISKYEKRKIDKALERHICGMVEYYEEQDRKNRAFEQAIEECILNNHWGDKCYLCTENKDGKLYKYNNGEPTLDDIGFARMRYEELLKESEVEE